MSHPNPVVVFLGRPLCSRYTVCSYFMTNSKSYSSSGGVLRPDNVFSRVDIFYSRTDWRRNRISWQGRVVILSYNTIIELALEFCCFLTVNISRLIYAAGVIWDAWFLVHTVWGRWDRLLADGWWWDGYTVCCKYHVLSDIDSLCWLKFHNCYFGFIYNPSLLFLWQFATHSHCSNVNSASGASHTS